MDVWIKWISAAVLSAFLVACGGGGGGGNGSNSGGGGGAFQSPKQILQSRPHCQYDLKGSKDTVARDMVFTTHLNKPYDQSCLDPLRGADLSVSLTYISKILNVPVFQVPVTGLGQFDCGPYGELPLPDADGMNHWMKMSDGQSGLAGLYVPAENPSSPLEILTPRIFIKTCADRWTVLHETMHHLFNLGRKEDPEYMSNYELNQLTNAAVEKYLATRKAYFEEFLDSSSLLVHVRSLDDLLTYYFEANRRTSLEEASIEATLIDLASKGQLINISPASLQGAMMYMEKSLNEFLAVMQGVKRDIQAIQEIAQENNYEAVSQEVKKHVETIDGYVRILNDLKAQAQTQLGAAGTQIPRAHYYPVEEQPVYHGQDHGNSELQESLERIHQVVIGLQQSWD